MSDTEKIQVVLVKPGKNAELGYIENKLEEYQKIVDGYIEQVSPFENHIAIICNEEGKIQGLMPNRAICDDRGEILDIIFGTFFICGIGEDDYCSLSDEDAAKYLKIFEKAEMFKYDLINNRLVKIYI